MSGPKTASVGQTVQCKQLTYYICSIVQELATDTNFLQTRFHTPLTERTSMTYPLMAPLRANVFVARLVITTGKILPSQLSLRRQVRTT